MLNKLIGIAMKNKLKITARILVTVVLLCVFADFIFYCVMTSHLNRGNNLSVKEYFENYHYYMPVKYNINNFKKTFRKREGNPQKGSIIFVGGSYLRGENLKREQTLPFKVWKLTNRSTYKFAIKDGGTQNLYDLFASGYVNKTVQNPEYIIYLYTPTDIDNMFNRQLDYYRTTMNKRYKIVNEDDVEVIPNKKYILNSLFCIKYLEMLNAEKEIQEEFDGDMDLFTTVMEKMYEKTGIIYKKQPKFVIIAYPGSDLADIDRNAKENYSTIPQEKKEELEEIGYIVIDAEDLTKKPIRKYSYRIENSEIPNEEAWDLISEPLVKLLKL